MRPALNIQEAPIPRLPVLGVVRGKPVKERAGKLAFTQAFRSGAIRPGRRAIEGASSACEDLPAAGAASGLPGLRIERLLAEGGMGAVYVARDVAGGDPVALKVLRREHAGAPGLRSRFAREVCFARRINHPNVCPVLADGCLTDGRPFYLMPLYEGVTLGEEVRRRGPLPIKRALVIADQILAGLSAMHAARVVHRDLQPDNVLLAEEPGGGCVVKLIDLGFAHEPGVDTGDGTTPDSPGALVGTVRFMSPEQVLRSRAITARSDLFAVGLLLFFALTGELPFDSCADHDTLVAIVRAAPTRLRRRRPDAPRMLEALLSRALAKHPDARFGSASEMRAALAAIAAERAPKAHRSRARSLQ